MLALGYRVGFSVSVDLANSIAIQDHWLLY